VEQPKSALSQESSDSAEIAENYFKDDTEFQELKAEVRAGTESLDRGEFATLEEVKKRAERRLPRFRTSVRAN
jgi:hypothetical protein